MSIQATMKALANPVRRDILSLLKSGAQAAGDISAHFELSNATVSHHLAQLKQADLIREQKVKNFIYYELNLSVFEETLVWLKGLIGEENDDKT